MSTTRSTALLLPLLGAITVACGGGASDATSASADALSDRTPVYLALGDSVPFGDNPFLHLTARTPSWFVGYPTFLGELIEAPVVNPSCPGQTSSGFVDPAGTDNGCFPFREEIGLHVSYDGAQLAFARDFLAAHRGTRLVTVALGANDVFLLLNACGGDLACVAPRVPETLTVVATNMVEILSTLRATGYAGQLVVPLYYSPYPDPSYRFLVGKLDETLAAVAAPFGANPVDLLAAFDAASAGVGRDPCAAGLLIPLPGGGCDVHPSEAGAELIARTIAAAVPARPE